MQVLPAEETICKHKTAGAQYQLWERKNSSHRGEYIGLGPEFELFLQGNIVRFPLQVGFYLVQVIAKCEEQRILKIQVMVDVKLHITGWGI